MRLVNLQMAEVPTLWKPRLKELTVDGYWAMSRWLHQDGSCYASILFEGDPTDPLTPAQIVCWAVLTFEDDEYPVIGVYVDPTRRGKGYAQAAVDMLFQIHQSEVDDAGGVVYAVNERWPKYRPMIAARGWTHKEWV